MLCVVCCVAFVCVVCYVLFVGPGLLCDVRCVLFVVWCWLFVKCWDLDVMYILFVMVCCVLVVACLCFFVFGRVCVFWCEVRVVCLFA